MEKKSIKKIEKNVNGKNGKKQSWKKENYFREIFVE